ncbi:2-amino-4-hydroxy-6-hydroxymethyldihydropteridine diphosphokinase [Flavobacterium arcticum]|uniref:2-amino-4-hydroxy-6-hydroxymethyldihydropteridine pyrophosphokinase n=1 Tax=Flavobacterium arcticum TaxID=1784713 RepID=A0A345HC69_9FLAO|nr:2-amino-4-hydroxy-6-hydroxymethyldihydropteridine diphosphokinase [Flavobacterium arcticum]AXG74179.1 2-amino-4-hydroxy-6-hydroxymethyldihydropteridine diphosphokinase [Flavobacterium arcticum]KAF2508233.1 2-amino-4-hydroxy-6-hydroxymethyldihydropteridine diphosphokinase [Flavobacterium arcticum]
MKFQNHAILSIGSNQGDRQQHLVSCVQYIHNHIATVIKVSAVYETPAWGFESDDFYNCAIVVHTHKAPEVLLEALLAAEEYAGRIRQEGKGYVARVIDIDIVAFNDEVVATDSLIVPHPRMQERNFVLYPLRDVAPQWEHPVSHKNITELITTSPDESRCEKLITLPLPLQEYNPESLNYIAIEGNIGAGKTTLSGKIAEDFNAKLVLERFADNPFLPKFYKDQNRYAFSLEMAFLADRYHQLSDDLAQFDLFRDFVVADYHIFKSLIFAKVTLNEDEYRLYRKLFDIIYKEMPKPDLYVYLYQNTDRLLQHIQQRGRDYEQDIKPEYLEKINRGYLDYINSQPTLNVLILDVSDRDFVKNQEDYIWVLDQIQTRLKQ